jgi:hypothetical protein
VGWFPVDKTEFPNLFSLRVVSFCEAGLARGSVRAAHRDDGGSNRHERERRTMAPKITECDLRGVALLAFEARIVL